MNDPLQKLILILLFTAAAFLGFYALLTKGYTVMGVMQATLWFAPLLAIGVICMHRFWVGIMIGALVAAFAPGVAVMANTSVGFMASASICGLAIAHRATSTSHRPAFRGLDAVCMVLVVGIVYARFAYDRPGSAVLGTTGGLREAIRYVLGATCYVVSVMLASEEWDVKRNWRVLVMLSGIAAGFVMLQERMNKPTIVITHNVFGHAAWLFCSLALAWAVYRESLPGGRPSRISLSAIIVLTIVVLGITTTFRSRPFYSLIIVFTVFTLSGQARRLTRLLLPIAVIVVTLAALLATGSLPKEYLRTLSTIVPVADYQFSQRYATERVTSETGWSSGWRLKLWKMALDSMAKRPIAGKGFKFSREDLLNDVAAAGGSSDIADYGGLVISGGFHNTLLETGVFLGIPCMLLFMIAYGIGTRDFIRTLRGLPFSPLRTFCTGIFSFLMVVTCQMLINGAAIEFWQICTLLGIMKGITVRAPFYDYVPEEEPRRPSVIPATATVMPRGPQVQIPGAAMTPRPSERIRHM